MHRTDTSSSYASLSAGTPALVYLLSHQCETAAAGRPLKYSSASQNERKPIYLPPAIYNYFQRMETKFLFVVLVCLFRRRAKESRNKLLPRSRVMFFWYHLSSIKFKNNVAGRTAAVPGELKMEKNCSKIAGILGDFLTKMCDTLHSRFPVLFTFFVRQHRLVTVPRVKRENGKMILGI